MRRAPQRARPVGAIEIVSSAAARLAPRALVPWIDQARHDARAIVDGLSGRREPPFVGPSSPRIVPLPLFAIDPIEHALPLRARHRWRVLRTDVRWLLRDLRGERRPTRVARGPSRYAREAPRGLSLRPLRVTSIVRETDDAVSIVLTELDGSPIAFEAGQFLTLELEIDGKRLRRAYSLSTSPRSGTSAITVKRIDGGRASSFLCESLREGDVLRALGPSGSFLLPRERAPRHLVMIAGGSGITPLVSLAETALESRPELAITLVYGNRRPRDVIFGARLDALAARHGERFELVHVLAEPEPGWIGLRGLLDRATLGELLGALRDRGPRLYYLCGPAAMMDAAKAELAARGVPLEDVREERFRSPADAPDAPLPNETFVAHVRVRGRENVVPVAPGRTLLEAGLAAGVRLPFSCAMGGCGACKVRLVGGTVHVAEPTCLTPEERAVGYVLACSARPTSPVTIEVER